MAAPIARRPAHLRTRYGVSLTRVVGWLRSRLSHDSHEWCPGTGMKISTGATDHGLARCPFCPKRVRAEVAPMARYRIIGEHTG